MKTRIILLLVTTLFCCAKSLAQDLSMLRSTDALRTYALEQSSKVISSIYASVAGNNSFSPVTVESPTAEGITNTIRRINLSVEIVNPNDYVFTTAGVYSAEGDVLFTGSNQFKLVEVEEGYALPTGYDDVVLGMYDTIPIRIEGIVAAQLTVQGKNGETQFGLPLNVYDQKVFFPRQLAGANAILAVYKEGGKANPSSWLYWDVRTGSPTETAGQYDITLKSSIQGVSVITDNNVMVSVPTKDSIGLNTTVELKLNNTRSVLASFWTTESKWFKGAWVRKSGTNQWQYNDATNMIDEKGNNVIGVLFSAQPGIYYIIPKWNDMDLIDPDNAWYPPYDVGKN